MKRAELQKGAVYFHKSGQWRTGEYVIVLETEPWYEYGSYSWQSRGNERFRPFTGGYGQSRNGVLVASLSAYGNHLGSWSADVVQLRNIKHLVCPADGDLAATFRKLDAERRQRKHQADEAERQRSLRYSLAKARAYKAVEAAGLTVVEGYTTSDWVSPTMGKVQVHRDGSFATVQMRVTDLEKLLAQLAERDRDLHQLENA